MKKFEPAGGNQGQYAVKILLDDPDQLKFSIGAQGRWPSTPAENTALGLRCAKSPSAPTPGSTGSVQSTF
ncbi:MAG TPA: hypothetical protein VEN78_31345 [Bradyrhizobium sp.]|nr:hypothetical protein [Bradyrhizobium sp.]